MEGCQIKAWLPRLHLVLGHLVHFHDFHGGRPVHLSVPTHPLGQTARVGQVFVVAVDNQHVRADIGQTLELAGLRELVLEIGRGHVPRAVTPGSRVARVPLARRGVPQNIDRHGLRRREHLGVLVEVRKLNAPGLAVADAVQVQPQSIVGQGLSVLNAPCGGLLAGHFDGLARFDGFNHVPVVQAPCVAHAGLDLVHRNIGGDFPLGALLRQGANVGFFGGFCHTTIVPKGPVLANRRVFCPLFYA